VARTTTNVPPVRKDDYAFFLKPVDIEKVPGYLEVVSKPMDFGTMTEKVAKSKYRSLDEFAVRYLTHGAALPSPRGGSQPALILLVRRKTFGS
jgi:hypothetical protein